MDIPWRRVTPRLGHDSSVETGARLRYEAAAAASPDHRAAAHRRAGELLAFGAERLATGPKRCPDDEAPPLDAKLLVAARDRIKAAADLGDAAAARQLASFVLAGLDEPPEEPSDQLMLPAPDAGSTPFIARPVGAASSDDNTAKAVKLLLAAAASDDARACAALSSRYRFGRGVPAAPEAAAWYALCAAAAAKDEFHTPGEQTFVELNRLTDETVADGSVDDAQRGDEDAELQAQLQRAEDGDPDACVAAGDLLRAAASRKSAEKEERASPSSSNETQKRAQTCPRPVFSKHSRRYWGARGFQRDHPRARRLFKSAADQDHGHARCLYAAMLLRGEGGEKDHKEAVSQYRHARVGFFFS